ncbi:hypothetical protein [Spiribacter pallidus]|uniref:Uncharacterized protein n=1 Tax=Spiribacter pallidus TaxID=1987936 RepID=A0ABV3TAY6_9GAMM
MTRSNAGPKRLSAILSEWRADPTRALALETSALGTLVECTMAPPWNGAVDVIETIADELDVTLDVDLRSLELNDTKPSRLKQEYPLFGTLQESLRTAKSAPDEAAGERARRQILVGLFGGFDGHEVTIYYDQFLKIRRCLTWLGTDMPTPLGDWRATAWAAHNALAAKKASEAVAPAELDEWLENFGKLLDGTREVGERLRDGGGGTPGPRRAMERLDDKDLHAPDFGRSIPRRSGKCRDQTPQPDRADPTLTAPGTDTLTVNLGGTRAEVKAASSDFEAALSIALSETSTTAPKDGRRMARLIADRAATSAVQSPAGASLLPLGRVRDALEVLANEPLDFLTAWLALTTTIDPERLMRLTQSAAKPPDETPHFDGEQLIYRLKNGPTAGDDDDDNLMVELVLPPRIAHYLRTWGGERPLAGRRDPIDRQLAYRLGNTPGATPSLKRLRKTGAYALERLAETRNTAQILSGGFNFGHIVPGTYRRERAGTLQALFAEHNETLAAELLKRSAPRNGLRPWLDGLKTPRDNLARPTGSARALAPEDYRGVFEALRSALIQARKAIRREPKGSSAEAQAQIEYLRLLAAQTYLAFELGTGARPIADRALATRVGKGVQSPQHALLLIRDKDSQAYREARVLPVANALGKALDQLNAAVNGCTKMLKTAGWRITDARGPGREDLPTWIELERGQQAVMQVFSNTDFARVLADYNIDDPRPSPNATRHTVCTALDPVLDEAAVHAVMSHTGAGGTYFQPESLASLDMGAVKNALADVLHRAGFRLI